MTIDGHQCVMWLKTMKVCYFRQHMLSVLGLLLIIECIISLKLLELRVPSHVPAGARVHLVCSWQLGAREVLYSVKWYKDGKEFFRHVPRDLERQRKFALPGVQVEEYESSGGNLTLSPAVLETSGRYRCEVSGEKPLFPTVSAHADLTVVVLPDNGPIVTGFRARYRPGDHVQVNCTSGRSKPGTKLAWYINGEPAPTEAVLTPLVENKGGLEATTLMLDFVVQERDFKQNGLKVKCLATIPPIYWRSNEESATQERGFHDHLTHYVISNRDIRVSRADRVSSNSAQQFCTARALELGLILLLCRALLL